MPEEINRIVADEFAEYLFLHSRRGPREPRREGIETRACISSGTHDRHARRDGAALSRGATAGRLGLAPGGYRPRDPAPASTRRRPAAEDRCWSASASWHRTRSSSPPIRAHARGWNAGPGRRLARPTAGLPRVPLARGGRRGSPHRLRWRAGGNLLPRGAVLHSARLDRATGDGAARNQYDAGPRPRAHQRHPSGPRRSATGRLAVAALDGHAAQRLADVVEKALTA